MSLFEKPTVLVIEFTELPEEMKEIVSGLPSVSSPEYPKMVCAAWFHEMICDVPSVRMIPSLADSTTERKRSS